MRWLLAGTACLCMTIVVLAVCVGPAWTGLIVLTTLLAAVIRAGSVWLDHAEMRARLDREADHTGLPPRRYTDTTGRPV